jgi:hypothetical protein
MHLNLLHDEMYDLKFILKISKLTSESGLRYPRQLKTVQKTNVHVLSAAVLGHRLH